jgi:S-formylglutathione hydrolase FrmB
MHSSKWLFLVACLILTQRVEAGESEWVMPPCQTVDFLKYGKFHSETVGREASYHILLPPSYHDDANRKFPVIYWLHGSNGSSRGCAGMSFLAKFYFDLMLDGEVPEAIVVFPNGLDHGMWCDSADGSQRPESMLVYDLVPFIDATYRTIKLRQYRAIEGFSMGGYGAGRIGFKHNDLFVSITMYGAGPLQPNFLVNDPKINPLRARQKIFQDVYGSDMAYYVENLPSSLALNVLESSYLRNQPNVRIIVGADDFLRKYNAEFSKRLKEELGIFHTYKEISGVGHDARQVMLANKEGSAEFYAGAFSVNPD